MSNERLMESEAMDNLALPKPKVLEGEILTNEQAEKEFVRIRRMRSCPIATCRQTLYFGPPKENPNDEKWCAMCGKRIM
jgi:hypothetical protein